MSFKDKDWTTPARIMPDGSPCWCYTEEDSMPGDKHMPPCEHKRTLTRERDAFEDYLNRVDPNAVPAIRAWLNGEGPLRAGAPE